MIKYILISAVIVIFCNTVVAAPKVIHVFVALCDNENQGIVSSNPKLENGMDPANNLYWGALYGVKTFFRKSKNWKLVETKKKFSKDILERVVFKHSINDVYLIADAYKGSEIKQAIIDFLSAAGGKELKTDLAVYIGHNGLMDFNLDRASLFKDSKKEQKRPGSIVLACKTKQYFSSLLKDMKSEPILLTTNYMAPESYTLEAALEGYMANEDTKKIRERAAQAYNKYQKCGINGARKLFDK